MRRAHVYRARFGQPANDRALEAEPPTWVDMDQYVHVLACAIGSNFSRPYESRLEPVVAGIYAEFVAESREERAASAFSHVVDIGRTEGDEQI